jgi:hypothetical protein
MYLLKELDINHILFDNRQDDVISGESFQYSQTDLDEHPILDNQIDSYSLTNINKNRCFIKEN